MNKVDLSETLDHIGFMSAYSWKTKLDNKISAPSKKLIDDFETTIQLKKEGKIDDKVFGETRLRMGAYGQRYDNGVRHDGSHLQDIRLPSDGKTKGVGTIWDAPGMQRIKIPYGGLTLQQLSTLADLAEEYSDDIIHITTRQDVQLHFLHIEDTPDLFRRLAAVGITTQEACGNSIRNITGCPYMGVCSDEPFDATPYAHQAFEYLLGHPDCQDFGRKFKISFSGCHQHACGQAQMHDMGFIAKIQDGTHGFKVVVGGGLGAVPMQAKVFFEFLPAANILKFIIATARIFTRYGEKKNRNRARLKFLINDWGIEKFKEEVLTEQSLMPFDETFQQSWPLPKDQVQDESAQNNAVKSSDTSFSKWLKNNVKKQKQSGYHTVVISLPLGDITSNQARKLSNILPHYIGTNTIRTTVEQDLFLRWIQTKDLEALYYDLKSLGLADSEYGTPKSIVACPGTDTCKLGISASRGLASELRRQFESGQIALPESAQYLKINASGCWNSCGQHHIADIGFYGISRKVGNYMVPHFQLVLGGHRQNNTESYGLATMAIPSKNVPAAITTLTNFFEENRNADESFQDFIKRQGKVKIKTLLADHTKIPDYMINPSFYKDWGDVRVYSKKDIGIGECAGEIVSLADFGLSTADREVFEAQVALDENKLEEAYQKALSAMMHVAEGFIKEWNTDIAFDYEILAKEFDEKLVQTKKITDPFAGDKFCKYFLNLKEKQQILKNKEHTHQFIEEAQLFIESCHRYNASR